MRWGICGLLFAAVVLSYVDRQVLSVLKPSLQHAYGWTETGYGDVVFWFLAAYGIGYVIFGRLVDRIGAKAGYTVAVTLWTLGQMGQALVTGTRGLALVRLPLALGESGAFPSALKAVAEWFPKKERALAIGLFNAGANIGAVLTPLIVAAIVPRLGWRAAFIVTGSFTVIWLAAWLIFYRTPSRHPRLSQTEREHIEADPVEAKRPVAWRTLLTRREAWAYILGRFLIDPVWWLFLSWLPDFFSKRFGVDMVHFGPPLAAIYVMADVGSIVGGWASGRLMSRGAGLNWGRKGAMLGCALAVLPVAFAGGVPQMWMAVLILGLACAGHQGFSANLYALPSDLFPPWAAGSVVGVGGLAGALGGMVMAKYAGFVLQHVGAFGPIFLVASLAYLTALAVIHLLTPRYKPATLPG